MARPTFVPIPPHPLERFRPLLGDRYPRVEEAVGNARREFGGRVIWHLSSTMRGGGVAEMLGTLLPYVRAAGIDTRWVVLREPPEFFELTKRIHNNLHGDPGDGGPLGDEQRALYEETLTRSARHLAGLVKAGDIVFLHDPQTAGLVETARAAGATVVWRCHVGVDRPDRIVRGAWDFLAPHVKGADAVVFSRDAYVWDGLDRERCWVMAPSIDPFSPKNQELDDGTEMEILAAIGLGTASGGPAPTFTCADGTPGRVERRAEVMQEAPLPSEARMVAQVSRWDRLKDHEGLLECFRRHDIDEALHLVLAGPATGAVADDPEGAAVWHEVGRSWSGLPVEVRRRIHLASLPMEDGDENAAMVNALQRRAEIVVQKSLAEGFGLTVAEAMWKRKPVIGSRVGGIQDQIVDGSSGILVDPTDLGQVAAAIGSLASDPELAAAIGGRAHERVLDRYLASGRLIEYVELLTAIDPRGEGQSPSSPRSSA